MLRRGHKGLGGRAVVEIIKGKVPNGSGYGDGSGSSSGYGDGSGSSSGYGAGSSSGYGDGSGSGVGSGFGSGSAYGAGSGDGYGSGSGSGYGSGSGDGTYWLSCLSYFAGKWPAAQRKQLTLAKKANAKIAFWRSDASGQPANNGSRLQAAAPGVIHIAPGPLKLCTAGTLHATLLPPKWKGERWWVVALHGKVIGDDEKFGCLRREIIGECL